MNICSVDGCNGVVCGFGLCNKHYQRFKKYGTTDLTPRVSKIKKWLDELVANPPAECVLWPFSVDSTSGYGILRVGKKTRTAHRYALILSTGDDPAGKTAAHGPCHNRLCCNPRHLSWKTTAENHADKVRDDTHNRGQRHYLAKLKPNQVLEIFADARMHKDIAKDYGVSRSVVSSIKTRIYWKWLTDGKEPNCGKRADWYPQAEAPDGSN